MNHLHRVNFVQFLPSFPVSIHRVVRSGNYPRPFQGPWHGPFRISYQRYLHVRVADFGVAVQSERLEH